ncbi:unnamed protein product [Rotaria sordida]|uniref:UPF3 domain-containing protein n=2 Tax=Rotaria sordida TaxID=392033 RepID=A0A818NB41_9BILA|nr:unnamed protein product [Rotaria sordida]CAF0990302.1 unnamed protein product [Rotaria sordida]CAF1216929.1 unnamed protein product [Rotaria sordida]CAF3602544.1 unnamed protein product [Rotaria sordida]CAF4016413.1 unnamed protein product [Rotaria sordida]
MVDRGSTGTKQHSSAINKSFNDQNQTKIVLRRLPPTLTSELFLEIVSPLPDHDYYRFCKADISFGQQYAFSRAYLDIPNRQDLIVFTEKFQGYVFLDKNGNEYICSVEYAPNQSRPKSEQQLRKDPKVNSIEQDPEYQTFVTNMNAPLSATEALPNAETMLEEIEKKQRDQDSKNKSGATTTPLLEFLKRKREERKQEKLIRIQQAQQQQQRRSNKQSSRNTASNTHDDSRPSSGRNMNDDDYNASSRYGGGDRSNRQQRGYDKSDYRTGNHEQKRSNANDYGGNKSSKNREHQTSKPKQQQQSSKESKIVTSTKSKNEESLASSQVESQTKRETTSTDTTNNINENSQNDERPSTSNKTSSTSSQKNSNAPTKNRPSIQIYDPAERARLRRQQNPSS